MLGGVVGGTIIFFIIPIFVAVAQGRAKDRAGLAYGIFLGWIGVIILAFLPPRRGDKYVECPFCKESIRRDALVCTHCLRDVRPRRAAHPPAQ
jgi:Na+/melibiose symporter-like transporter